MQEFSALTMAGLKPGRVEAGGNIIRGTKMAECKDDDHPMPEPKGLGYKSRKIETDLYVGFAEFYRQPIMKDGGVGEGKICMLIPRGSIEIRTKKTGSVIRFPFTKRKGSEPFGDNRETANRLKTRWSVAGMRAEQARMVGPAGSEALLSIFPAD